MPPCLARSAKCYSGAVNCRRSSTPNCTRLQRLYQAGISREKVNIRNKLSRGKFTAAFFLQCLSAIGAQQLQL
ncbi:DUF6471 domain-containing protein [Aliihoeflea sp. 40Bstr573]|uniref:DUF6471 domain-containing protein n=1 Tax=Aliihoeflea sp. 40Bstr573 TaxID=2696467 RepID=UPI003531EDFF